MRTLYLVAFAAVGTFAAGVAAAAEKSAAAAKGGNTPAALAAAKFVGTADLADLVQIAAGFSDDKQAVSLLCRNLGGG